MSNVVNFRCLRILSELDIFKRTGILPHALLEGTVSVEDIEKCYENFSLEHRRYATKLINLYKKQLKCDYNELLDTFKKDYYHTLQTLRSTNSEFQFDLVLAFYRKSINPITALYYEVREIQRNYNPISNYHTWLHSLINDKEFNNRIQDALYYDIILLEKIINLYYWPFKNSDKHIPLEIHHAKSLIRDFKEHLSFFQNIADWELDE